MHDMLKAAVVGAALGLCVGAASAQTFKPTRHIEFVTHTGPGGGNDVVARRIAQIADQEKLLGDRRLQVVNKTGGGSITAMSYMVEKKGDPHTIAIMANTWITAAVTSAEARVSPADLTPIARLVSEPAIVAVKAGSPYKSLRDFIEAAQKTPGKLKQAGGSPLAREGITRHMLQKSTGAQWAYISFPGNGERIAALLGGHVDLMILEPQEAGEHIRNGGLRAVAQIGERKLAAFADVPTLKEAGFDVPYYPVMRGVMGPPGMPKEVVAFYEDFFTRLVQTAAWKKYLADNLFDDAFLGSSQFGPFMADLTERVRGTLTSAGIKVVR